MFSRTINDKLTQYFRDTLCLIIILLCIGTIPGEALAYPPYVANSDIVRVAPYGVNATSGAANWGRTGISTRDFITIGHRYRIRETGTINRIRLYIANLTNTPGIYIKIWRLNGSNLYDLVGSSENLVSKLTVGFNTVDLSSPITGVQEGDYVGYRVETNGSTGDGQLFALTGQTGVASYLVTDSTPSATNFDWVAQQNYAGTVVPIEIYMQAPQVVGIGDSIMSGAPNSRAYLVDNPSSPQSNPPTTILGKLRSLTNYNYQNMGIGSQTSTNIAARFTADVINLHPRIVVINAGVNDLAGGSINKSTFLANWTSMLDAAQASSSITTVIVLKILPWTNGTNTQMQTRDDWNNSLATLAAGYSKAIVVDASSYVGQFRPSGDVGNMWDIQTAYDSGGVHFLEAGHGQIAQAIADALPQPPTISSITSTTPNGAYRAGTNIPITVNFSHAVTSTGNVTVTLNTAPVRTCTFTVSNETSGTCTYTVQAGDTATTLDATISSSGSITDDPGNTMSDFTPTSNLSASKTINIDTANPVVAEVTPVSETAETDTPVYTFSSTEAGTITYGGECSSATTVATVGDNIITFNSLYNGTHSNCTIIVVDAAGNNSNTLSVTPFTTNISLGGSQRYTQSSDANTNNNSTGAGSVAGVSGENSSVSQSDTSLASQLQDQIQALTTQINTLLAQTASILTEPLFYGAKGDQVVLLQNILKQQGFFPAAIVSNGRFGPTTLRAVQVFQVQYNIAGPGIRGYGLVGPKTRTTLNQLAK